MPLPRAVSALAAAALASAVAVTPASAAPPVQGACHFSVVSPSTIVLASYAVASTPTTEVGSACWLAEGGEAWASASNPGVVAVAAGQGTLWGLSFMVCEQHWMRLSTGGYYVSPIACQE